MYCVHLCPSSPPVHPVAKESYHWLDVDGGQTLVVHGNCHQCAQDDTRLPHVLGPGPVGNAVASALAAYGVVATDTLVQAMMKVGPHWPPAWP